MKRIILCPALALLCAAAFAQPKLTKDNIDEVLSAMTIEEKAEILTGCELYNQYVGPFTADSTTKVPGSAGSTKAFDRFGIPKTALADGPAGIRIAPLRDGDSTTYYCTGYPCGTLLACSWNVPMVEEMLATMGEEMVDYGVDLLLAPGLNLHRNPLCGRNFEYFSEDPVLSGKIAAAYTRGVQSKGVGVTLKHFFANNQETNRSENDSKIDVRTMREFYLKNFEIAVRESQPWAIMSSYNKVNGFYTQQNPGLLTTILRDEWGYKGIVMTDWGYKEGTVNAIIAGNDLMMPGSLAETQRIIAAVKDGSLDEKYLDTAVRRMLEYIVKTPAFAAYQFSNKPDLKAHAEYERKNAPEGMVLLKNQRQALPLAGNEKVALFGLTAYESVAGGTGSGNVSKPYILNLSDELVAAGMTLDPKIEAFYKAYKPFWVAEDAALEVDRSTLWGQFVIPEVAVKRHIVENSVDDNDLAIIVIGRNAGEGFDRVNEEGDFELSAAEKNLVVDVCNIYQAKGKKVIVVMNIGGVIETASWKSNPDAILLAWVPGQDVGGSIADVLTGKSYPSGKLSMTFPVSYASIPSSANFPSCYYAIDVNGPKPIKDFDCTKYEEGLNVGYRYFTSYGAEVSYPFGYGLSYTTFSYSKPSAKVAGDGSVTFSITVTNTGKAVGKEAVQAYVSAPAGGLEKPCRELKAFAKTKELKPGESQTLTMKVSAYDLASFNADASQWETAKGAYKVLFGASVEDIRCTSSFNRSKARTWAVNPVLIPKE